LAYLVGATWGDGNLSYNKQGRYWRITLRATDREFVDEYERCLSVLLGRRYRVRIYRFAKSPEHTDQWRVDAQSRILYDYLSQGPESIRLLLDAYPTDYLRGFFDAEGSAYERKWDGRSYWGIRVVNTSANLILLAHQLLLRLGIEGKIYVDERKSAPNLKWLYIWICQKRDQVRRYRDLIGFSIPRKVATLATLPAG